VIELIPKSCFITITLLDPEELQEEDEVQVLEVPDEVHAPEVPNVDDDLNSESKIIIETEKKSK
jgi:hypothetical protein